MDATGIALDQSKRPQASRVALLFKPGQSNPEEHKGEGKGNKITLEQAQKLVGGYVERVQTAKGCILADEDGFSKGLPGLILPFSTPAGSSFVGPVLYIPRGMGW